MRPGGILIILIILLVHFTTRIVCCGGTRLCSFHLLKAVALGGTQVMPLVASR